MPQKLQYNVTNFLPVRVDPTWRMPPKRKGEAAPSSKPSGKAGTSAACDDEDMAAHGDAHAAFREAMGLGPDDYRPRPRVVPPVPPAPGPVANPFADVDMDSD